MKKLSLNRKLVTLFLATGIIPVLLVSAVIFTENTKVLTSEAKNKLIAIREARGFQLEELYKTMKGQVFALSNNQLTVDAMRGMDKAYDDYLSSSGINVTQVEGKLKDYYTNEFGKTYVESNIDLKFDKLDEIFGKLDDTTKALQHSFISGNSNALGEKDKLYDLNDSTEYAKLHSKYHKTFRTYLQTFGYYDIFLVSKKSGRIVYSVFKELDYATSLKNGPYAGSGLGIAYKKAVDGNTEDNVYLTEMDMYYPSYDAPAQFVSKAIYENGEMLGVLIFQIPVDKINQITTGSNRWKEQGLGNSGEVYVVGKNKKMKSVSRFLVESEAEFLSLFKDLGIDQPALNYIQAKKTSAVVVEVNTKGVDKVIAGETGFEIFNDYRDESVLSAFRPLSIEGLDWYILSEMDEVEALDSVSYLKKLVLILLIVFLIVILFISSFFSRGISSQLVKLADVLKQGADNLLSSAIGISETASKLSSATQEQAASLQETSSSINEISAMVERSSDSAKYTSEISNSSKAKAVEGKNSVANVKNKIDAIHGNNQNLIKSVEENNREIEGIQNVIGEIENKTKVINDIVFQTKLLSFNASVEAARAGENGKGFAVVAEEVGALAQMSGKAAAEIAELLARSTKRVNDSVESSKQGMRIIIDEGKAKVEEVIIGIDQCGAILEDIVSSFDGVSSSVNDIASSSSEQSAGVNEIKQAIQQLDAVTQQNTGVAHESSQKADELKNQSVTLSDTVKQIQTLVFGSSETDKD